MELLVGYIPVGIICGVIAGFISRDKGRGFAFGFIAGLFLGIIGIIIAAMSGGTSSTAAEASEYRVCPHCKERMRRDASVCPSCQRESKPWTLKDGRWWHQSKSGTWWWLDDKSNRWEQAS